MALATLWVVSGLAVQPTRPSYREFQVLTLYGLKTVEVLGLLFWLGGCIVSWGFGVCWGFGFA